MYLLGSLPTFNSPRHPPSISENSVKASSPQIRATSLAARSALAQPVMPCAAPIVFSLPEGEATCFSAPLLPATKTRRSRRHSSPTT